MTQTRTRNRAREIYFVQAFNMRLIKIGVTNDTGARLRSLQTFSPDYLYVMGVQICLRGGDLEKELHQRFAEYREHGEWFHPGPKLLAYIEENTVPLDDAAQARAALVADVSTAERAEKDFAKRQDRWLRKNGFSHLIGDCAT